MASKKVHPAGKTGAVDSKRKLMNIIARARMVHGKKKYQETAVAPQADKHFDFSEFLATTDEPDPFTIRVKMPPPEVDPEGRFEFQIVHQRTALRPLVVGECANKISNFFNMTTRKPFSIYAKPDCPEEAVFRLKLSHAITLRDGSEAREFAGSVKGSMRLLDGCVEIEFESCLSLRDISLALLRKQSNLKGAYGVIGLFAGYFVFGILAYSLLGFKAMSDSYESRLERADEPCNRTYNVTVNATGNPGAHDIYDPQTKAPVTGSPAERIAESFYFLSVMATTVGYGDITPNNDEKATKVMTLFFAIWGILNLGMAVGTLGKVRGEIMNYITRKCCGKHLGESKKEGCWSSNSGQWNRLIGSIVGFKIVIVVGMLLYYLTHLEDSPTFINCLYYSVISATTIGYGDEAPKTIVGRVFTALYILMALPLFGNLTATLISLPLERRKKHAEAQVLAAYGKDLSLDEMRSLVSHTGKSKTSCTRAQFCLAMLIRMQKVKPADARAVGKVFDSLDHNQSGDLDVNDVTEMAEGTPMYMPSSPAEIQIKKEDIEVVNSINDKRHK